MEGKYDVLVLGEKRIEVGLVQSMRMLACRLQLHQIDDVDHTDLQFGQIFTQDGHGRQDLQRRRVSATGHYHVGFAVLVVACPLPDAKTLRAVHDGLFHSQPLRQSVFPGNHHVHVMSAAQAVIER